MEKDKEKVQDDQKERKTRRHRNRKRKWAQRQRGRRRNSRRRRRKKSDIVLCYNDITTQNFAKFPKVKIRCSTARVLGINFRIDSAIGPPPQL